jgi:hypothetical protein
MESMRSRNRVDLSRQARRPIQEDERRRAHRYEPLTEAAQFGWWENDGFQQRPALLLDVSHGGLLLSCNASPPQGEPVYVFVEGQQQTGWVEANVVKVVKSRGSASQFHLHFPEGCPYGFFMTAVYGDESQNPLHRRRS